MSLTGLQSWDYGSHWNRIVAIGDVHGDLDGLLRILIGLRVLDGDGTWIAPSTLVLLVGDLNDRGPDSTSVVSFMIRLQQDAIVNGGRVESLLGNHELLAARGDYSYARAVEVLAMEEFRFDQRMGLNAFYRGTSRYAAWIKSRPVIVKAGDCLFMHAGFGNWLREHHPDWVNSTVASWVAGFQGVADMPDSGTRWLVDGEDNGPLWTFTFAVDAAVHQHTRSSGQTITAVLDSWEAKHLVVGHTPTRNIDYSIAYPHPAYGEAVAVIDTGISRWFSGRLSALEIQNESLTPLYFERGLEDLALTQRIRKASKEEMIDEFVRSRRTCFPA